MGNQKDITTEENINSLCGKQKQRKKINEIRREVSILDKLLRRVKVK